MLSATGTFGVRLDSFENWINAFPRPQQTKHTKILK